MRCVIEVSFASRICVKSFGKRSHTGEEQSRESLWANTTVELIVTWTAPSLIVKYPKLRLRFGKRLTALQILVISFNVLNSYWFRWRSLWGFLIPDWWISLATSSSPVSKRPDKRCGTRPFPPARVWTVCDRRRRSGQPRFDLHH